MEPAQNDETNFLEDGTAQDKAWRPELDMQLRVFTNFYQAIHFGEYQRAQDYLNLLRLVRVSGLQSASDGAFGTALRLFRFALRKRFQAECLPYVERAL